MRCVAAPNSCLLGGEQQQVPVAPLSSTQSRQIPSTLTIEQAIQDYLEDRKRHHRQPKTIEWHERALELFQRYLRSQHECLQPCQITEAQVHGWFVFLSQKRSGRGSLLQTSTVESYARAARAFCHWLVRHNYLHATPFAQLALPRLETSVHQPLASEEWEQMLQACHSARKCRMLAERATARNRAILWLLFETGMRVSELCALRLSDVDREQGILLIRGKGARTRRLSLGHEGLHHLRAYLDTSRLGITAPVEQRGVGEDHLFLSETGLPLTRNGVALLFGRLWKRAGIRRKSVSPSLLRESFALRFLQTGGVPFILQELLGYTEQATSARYQRLSAETLAQQYRKEPPGNPSLDQQRGRPLCKESKAGWKAL